jgi:hypothetical protein
MIADDIDLSIELPVPQEPEVTPPSEPEEFKILTPHESIGLDGVLCCGLPLRRVRTDISGIVLRPLINLVRQVTDWTDPSGDEGQYLGDYRFLVLDTVTASGIETFVQIWSEPFDELTVEVGRAIAPMRPSNHSPIRSGSRSTIGDLRSVAMPVTSENRSLFLRKTMRRVWPASCWQFSWMCCATMAEAISLTSFSRNRTCGPATSWPD